MKQQTSVGELFIKEIRARLSDSFERIIHCVSQLSDQQVWWRPQESMNSIANILLHLCGNMRQWIIHGVTNAPDHRDRPEEFSNRSMLAKNELIARLAKVVHESDQLLSAMNERQLLLERRIQGFDETVLSAILNSVSHFNGHTQEIVYITRLQLGSSYRFAWTPSTPEQGAPPK
ncbi:MAG: DUF1572 family protein [Gemmatales bacterium]